MKTLTLIVSCCATAAALLCPRTAKIDWIDLSYSDYVWVINVTHSEARGNEVKDYWVYWVKYLDFVKYFLFWQYKPNEFTVRRREPGKENCSVSLENGKQYVVGYNFWVPQFRFVRPKDNITKAEDELMKKMRRYYI